MNLKRNIHYENKNISIQPRPKVRVCRSIPTSFKPFGQLHSTYPKLKSIDGKQDIYLSKNVNIENRLYNINSIDTKCYSKTLPYKNNGLDMDELHPVAYTNYYSYNIVPAIGQTNNCFPGGRLQNGSIYVDNKNPNIYEKPIIFTDYIPTNNDFKVGPIRINHGIERIWDNPTTRKLLY